MNKLVLVVCFLIIVLIGAYHYFHESYLQSSNRKIESEISSETSGCNIEQQLQTLKNCKIISKTELSNFVSWSFTTTSKESDITNAMSSIAGVVEGTKPKVQDNEFLKNAYVFEGSLKIAYAYLPLDELREMDLNLTDNTQLITLVAFEYDKNRDP